MEREQECGGAYIKLLDQDEFDKYYFSKDTPYLLMFGPDFCGGLDELKI
jgi:calnexin